MAHEVEIAWAAGLFEGKGCFSLMKARPRKIDGFVRQYIIVGLPSTDLDVLQRFMGVVGCGNITERKHRVAHHKPQWAWRATKHEDFLKLLKMFMPYLCRRRRDRALEVLHAYTSQPVRRVSKTHCPHGHEFTPENTHYVNNKWRRCRTCSREASHRAYAKRKAIA